MPCDVGFLCEVLGFSHKDAMRCAALRLRLVLSGRSWLREEGMWDREQRRTQSQGQEVRQ